MKNGRVALSLLGGLIILFAAPVARTNVQGAGTDGSGTPNGPTAGQAEVRFANGSIVVMSLLQEHVEIMTAYGKLVVPQKDIRLIEFGVHLTDDERQKTEDAVTRLSSNAFADRETAVRDLVELGPRAYARLHRVAANGDAEATKRADLAIRRIRENVHPRLLRTRDDDVVRTVKFAIVGRIVNPTLKAKAEEFGELELRPAKLLAIRWLAAEASKEVTVDAATFGSQGGQKWMETGIRVGPHMGLKVTAMGQVDLWPQQPGQYMAGPDGNNGGGGRGMMMVNQPVRIGKATGAGGELLGRIGADGVPFVIGARHTQTPKDAGVLYLQIVPSPWGTASAGEYRVTITTGLFADESNTDE